MLANLADGMTTDEILAQYPSLTAEDVQAALAYAAELAAEEDITPLWRTGAAPKSAMKNVCPKLEAKASRNPKERNRGFRRMNYR